MSYYSYAVFRKIKDMSFPRPLIKPLLPIPIIPIKKYEMYKYDPDKWNKKKDNINTNPHIFIDKTTEAKVRFLVIGTLLIGFIGLIRYIDKN
jgi:hypothetical protein